MSGPRPPAAARWLVSALLSEPTREFVLGDLEEQFHQRRSLGPAAAWWRYWGQAARLVGHARALRHRRVAEATAARRFDMSHAWHDVVVGIRTAVRSPGYSTVTMLTLALAIGANTLLFSIANPLIVQALPIAEPERLGWIVMSHQERGITRSPASLPDVLDWRAGMKTLQPMAAYEIGSGALVGHGDARRIQVNRVTANLFDVWGLKPERGRLFLPGEDTPGRSVAGVLSYRFWHQEFQGDPAAVGLTLLFDGQPLTIVGVLPQAIEIGSLAEVDIWVPLPLNPTAPRDRRSLRVVGVLAPGATLESADAELQTLISTQRTQHPRTNAGWEGHVRSTKVARASDDTWVILGLLAVVVIFVLLIACANLANLVLARLMARQRDAEIRLALGASRWQIIRPLVAESLALSAAGGLAGLALAHGGLRLINATASDQVLRTVAIDGNVLIFTALLSLVTPLIFAAWPAFFAGRRAAADALHGARTTAGRGAGRRRGVLVGAQVALALALLVVSGLVVQSMLYLERIDTGLDTERLLTFTFELPAGRYPGDAERAAFAGDFERQLAGLPGVTGSTLVHHVPVIAADVARRLSGTRHDGDSDANRPWASWFPVTPGFFDAAGVTRLAGRTFQVSDTAGREGVAVLNRLAAERYFDRVEDAVDRTIGVRTADGDERRVRIVGVVADTRDAQMTRTSPQIFVPFGQWPSASMTALVRADDPITIAPAVRTLMRRVDATVALSELKVLHQIVAEDLSGTRIINGLFISFAGVALALAAAGLFGVISYSVGQRRREIGIRLALGASPRTIGRMVVREGLLVAGAGVAVGLLLATFLARASASVLFGIGPGDPTTFATVTGLVLAVALAATWSPAARAMRVDPARTLRE